MDETPVEELFSDLKCLSCGQTYTMQNIQVLKHLNRVWFLNVNCEACGIRGTTAIAVRESQEVATADSLTSTAKAKPRKATLITLDDALDVKTFVASFNGDFQQHFAQNKML